MWLLESVQEAMQERNTATPGCPVMMTERAVSPTRDSSWYLTQWSYILIVLPDPQPGILDPDDAKVQSIAFCTNVIGVINIHGRM